MNCTYSTFVNFWNILLLPVIIASGAALVWILIPFPPCQSWYQERIIYGVEVNSQILNACFTYLAILNLPTRGLLARVWLRWKHSLQRETRRHCLNNMTTASDTERAISAAGADADADTDTDTAGIVNNQQQMTYQATNLHELELITAFPSIWNYYSFKAEEAIRVHKEQELHLEDHHVLPSNTATANGTRHQHEQFVDVAQPAESIYIDVHLSSSEQLQGSSPDQPAETASPLHGTGSNYSAGNSKSGSFSFVQSRENSGQFGISGSRLETIDAAARHYDVEESSDFYRVNSKDDIVTIKKYATSSADVASSPLTATATAAAAAAHPAINHNHSNHGKEPAHATDELPVRATETVCVSVTVEDVPNTTGTTADHAEKKSIEEVAAVVSKSLVLVIENKEAADEYVRTKAFEKTRLVILLLNINVYFQFPLALLMWIFTPYNRPNPAIYVLVVICLGSGISGQALPGYLAYKLHKLRKVKEEKEAKEREEKDERERRTSDLDEEEA